MQYIECNGYDFVNVDPTGAETPAALLDDATTLSVTEGIEASEVFVSAVISPLASDQQEMPQPFSQTIMNSSRVSMGNPFVGDTFNSEIYLAQVLADLPVTYQGGGTPFDASLLTRQDAFVPVPGRNNS